MIVATILKIIDALSIKTTKYPGRNCPGKLITNGWSMFNVKALGTLHNANYCWIGSNMRPRNQEIVLRIHRHSRSQRCSNDEKIFILPNVVETKV